MIAPQQFGCYPVFGCAATKCEPNPVKYETGYIPGDVLPAEHLNWFLGNDTAGYNLLCAGVSSIEQELATVLSCAGCTPDPTSCSQVYNAVMYQINACITACSAPKAHASSETTYGVGNADCYGHLKLSDTFDSVLSACSGVAASQCALATAYACLSASGAQLGNTKGCALGTAAAGTATTAARSDHVHPLPTCIACADCGSCSGTYKAFGSNAFNSTAFTTCKGTVTIANCDTAKPVALCTGATSVGTSACTDSVFRLMYNPTCRCMYAAMAGGETCWIRYEGFSDGTKRAEKIGPNLCTMKFTCNGRAGCCFCYTVCTRTPSLVLQRTETNASSIAYAGADRVLFGTGGLICTTYFYANWGCTSWNENAAFNCFAKCYQVIPLCCTIPDYN